MQIKLFTIPIGDSGALLQEMNAFLKAHKILEIQQKLISNDNGANWCFCVRYIEQTFNPASGSKAKIDYRQVLDEPTFRKFSHLREIRKQVAAKEGLPFLGYLLFPDRVRLARRSKKRFIQKSLLYDHCLQTGSWSQKQFANHTLPLVAFTQYANAKEFRKNVYRTMVASAEQGH